jgi:hypothetical protein
MIHSIPSSQAARMLVSDWRLVKRWLALIGNALLHFFLPQFASRLRPHLRPVATLSHPLDRDIPFRPREVVAYLGYMTFWFKTLRWLYDRIGPAALPDILRSMDEVLRLYREAGAIYRRCSSTTSTRPPLPGHPYFALIYLVDPHLACIPSLHILLICHNEIDAARILRRHGLAAADSRKFLDAVRDEAKRITETVLAVKQHSVVDVAPTLFLLTALFPDFRRKEVRAFVGRLFRDWPRPEAYKQSLRSLILSTYEGFLADYEAGGKTGHRERIVEFLKRYAAGGRAGFSSSPLGRV